MDDDIDGPETRESRILINCHHELALALHPDNSNFISFLRVEGLITEEAYDSVLDPYSKLTEDQRLNILLKEIGKKVWLNPKNYHIFTGYL